ncbi:MAG: GAF domain-containing protein [Thermoguttaceae bacterium]
MVRPDSLPVIVEVHSWPISPGTRISSVCDITARRRSQQRADRQRAVLQGINRILSDALTCRTEEALGETCLAVAEEVTGSQIGFIGEIGADGLVHDVATSDSARNACPMSETAGQRRVAGGLPIRGICARVVSDGKPVLANHPDRDPDWIGATPEHAAIHSFLGIPLLRDGRAVGVIAVANRDGGYQRDDLLALQALAPVIVEAFGRKRTEEALRSSDERLRFVADRAQIGYWHWDIPRDRLEWSTACQRLFGIPDDEKMSYSRFVATIHPADQARADHAVRACLESAGTMGYDIEYRTRRPDGEIRWVHAKGDAIFLEGKPVRMAAIVLDVTERKRRQERLAKVTRLYAVLSQVNEVIVRAETTDRLYAEVCRIIAEVGNFPCVWIGEQREQKLVAMAADGPAAEYGRTIHVEIDGPFGSGPSGTSFREDRAVVANDFATNPSTAPWQQPALPYGFQASAAFPLRRQGRPIGVLTLYTCDPEAFDDEQIRLLDALSADVSFSLDAIEEERLRVRAERDLADALQRLRALMQAVPVGISFSDDVTCQRVTGNPAALAQFEVRAEDNLSASDADASSAGHNVRYFKDGRRLTEAELPLQRAVTEKREIASMELQIELPSGRRWHASASGAPICDIDGNVVGGVAVTVDLTDRKNAEERARLLSDVTAQLLASDKPQAVVESLCRRVMDHLGCHVFFNYLADEEAGCLRLNAYGGIPAEAAKQVKTRDLGGTPCGCVARDGRRIVAENIQASADPNATLVRPYGVQAYACHPLTSQGQVLGTLSFGSKTKTAFNDSELNLMRAVADHVSIAVQRIRLLESLERHAKAAEAANLAKSQFLANMSHELRTPMNAIVGMVDAALPKASDPVMRDYLQTARSSADLLLALLNDLLDSARIESGKLTLESAPFSLRRTLEQTARIVSLRAKDKGLRFDCRVADGTPDAVVGDRTRLEQVLLNLASNAIKFTERGEVEIRVESGESSVESDEPKADHGPQNRDSAEAVQTPLPSPLSPLPCPLSTLHFSVRDTGIGIPAESLERLFQPFVQADASMVRRFGGTGLGLHICKSLVEMMGGRIRVDSEVGLGSTFSFTIRLPLAGEVSGEPDPLLSAAASPSRQLRILLVEDNPANQKVAAHILADRGHAVEIASDGHEAVRLTAQRKYDAVLMDVQMPGMNGLETTAAIRRRELDGPRVPIIATTAHTLDGDAERCLAAGMDAYMPKPIDARKVIAVVERLAGLHPIGAGDGDSIAHACNGSPRVPAGSPPLFDPAAALRHCLGKHELLLQMIQFFFEDVEKILPRIAAAAQQGNLTEVGRLGHRLKGTISHLAAERAHRAAGQVENIGRPGSPQTEAVAAVEQLHRECYALRETLTNHPVWNRASRNGL